MFLKVINSDLIETRNLDSDGNMIPAKRVGFVMFDSREDLNDEIDNGSQKSRLMPLDYAVTTANGSPRVVRGKIVEFETTPYEVGGNVVKRRKFVVFDSENAVEVGNSLLKSSNACIILNGKPTIEGVGLKTPNEPTKKPEKKLAEQ